MVSEDRTWSKADACVSSVTVVVIVLVLPLYFCCTPEMTSLQHLPQCSILAINFIQPLYLFINIYCVQNYG